MHVEIAVVEIDRPVIADPFRDPLRWALSTTILRIASAVTEGIGGAKPSAVG